MIVNEDLIQAKIKKIANTNKLPTLPEVAIRLIEIAQQPDPDTREVCKVIRTDPAITEKILKTVNSALFAFRPKVKTIEQAVPKLGVVMIRTLILSFHLSRHRQEGEEFKGIFQDLWRSCLTQAVFAELIAERTGGDAGVSFMAAMLQDIGILAMLSESPREYRDNVLSVASFPNVAAAEREYFGFSHVDVSAEKVRQWNMEDGLAQAIMHHHDKLVPWRTKDPNALGRILQAAGRGAEFMLRSSNSQAQLSVSLTEFAHYLEKQCGIDSSELDALLTDVEERVQEYSVIFNFDIGDADDGEDIVGLAKDLIQEIALRSQMELLQKAPVWSKRHPENNELFKDCMTGLFNRRYLNEYMLEKLDIWMTKGQSIALLFLDVDRFKKINDGFGHNAGDAAIEHVARWLQQATRKTDHLIRLGGDEFLVIMPTEEGVCRRVAERIANDIQPMPLPGSEKTIPMSLSVGCVYYQPMAGDEVDLNWLIDQADQLMYRAKRDEEGHLSIKKIVGQELVSA